MLVSQTGLYERSPTYAREKMLGGCSLHSKFISKFVKKTELLSVHPDTGNIGSMYYIRGSKNDWNSWSGIVDIQQLSWNEILLFILGMRS